MHTSTSHVGTAPVLLTDRRGPLLILTLNRPDARNAVDGELAAAIATSPLLA